jgi:hypothetical protein
VKCTRLFSLIFLFPLLASAQVPTLVQHVTCPDSRNTGNQQSSTPVYTCPLPEPTQAGNAIIVGVKAFNSGSFSVTDDKGNSYGAAKVSVVDNNSAFVAIYVATNVLAGTRTVSFNETSVNADFSEVTVSEYYNVAQSSAVDTSHCNGNTGTSGTSIMAGSITPTTSGDLLWQYAVNTGAGGSSPNTVSAFTVGTQSAIPWQLLGTSLFDGNAVQAGAYNTTAAINPTFTSGSSEQWTSCVVALKAANAGSPPTAAFRVVHILHEQDCAAGAGRCPSNSPASIQFPSSGNLIIVADTSGATPISSITSTPTNTWSSTGSMAGSSSNTAGSQIYYAANAATSNSLTFTVNFSGSLADTTMLVYDVVGAAVSPFDKDSCPSGAYSNASCGANQTSEAFSFTTCSGCLTPAGVSGGTELVIGASNWNFGTATAVTTTPSGGLFDAATYTGNSVNGPEYVDQNGGWFHLYTTGTTPISNTWTMSLNQAESWWGGRMAAFKSASSVTQKPAPPTQLNAVVN